MSQAGIVNIPEGGGITAINGINGITTSQVGSTVTIGIGVAGTVTTTNATPTTIISFPLGAVPGVYIMEGVISAFDTTDTAGAGYTWSASYRTTGAAGIEIGTDTGVIFEEVAMNAAGFDLTISGNSLLVQAVGIAATTIDWAAQFTFKFVS